MPMSAPPERFEPTRVPASSRLDLTLGSGEIRSIIWATGFRPDYSWLDVPVLDRKGYLRHDGGVVDAPGLYAIGLPVLRRRKSTLHPWRRGRRARYRWTSRGLPRPHGSRGDRHIAEGCGAAE